MRSFRHYIWHFFFCMAVQSIGVSLPKGQVFSSVKWPGTPLQACLMLAGPGDLMIHVDRHAKWGSKFGPIFTSMIVLKEWLTLNPYLKRYTHSAIVTRTAGETLDELKLGVNDFMPNTEKGIPLLAPGKAHERESSKLKEFGALAFYRIKGSRRNPSLGQREAALERLERGGFSGRGTCSDRDFWAFDGKMHYYWNFIPGLNTFLERKVPPFNTHSPANLANSPAVKKICDYEVSADRNEHVVLYPLTVSLPLWLKDLSLETKSRVPAIRDNAQRKLTLLKELNLAQKSGEIWISRHDGVQFVN